MRSPPVVAAVGILPSEFYVTVKIDIATILAGVTALIALLR